MSTAKKEGIEGVNSDVNDLAVQYIIPVSVIVGVVLAAVTIGCVCYRRWRFILRIRKQKQEGGAANTSMITSSEDEETQKNKTVTTEDRIVVKNDSLKSDSSVKIVSPMNQILTPKSQQSTRREQKDPL